MVIIQELIAKWEDWLWKGTPERKELAHKRLTLHRKALLEGKPSPYTHPEMYYSQL